MVDIIIFLVVLLPIVFLFYSRVVSFSKTLNLNIFDGLFLGGVIFILTPVISILLSGKLEIDDFDIKYRYNVQRDLETFVYIVYSLVLIGLVTVLQKDKRRINRAVMSKISDFERRLFVCFFLLYFFAEILFFIKSGKSSGNSHWYGSNQEVFQEGALFVLIAQFHNVGRVVLPGLLMLFHLKCPTKPVIRLHFIMTFVILSVELVLTGNRISMLFLLLSLIIPVLLYRNYKVLLVLFLLFVPAIKIAQIWPMVRGLIWTQSFSQKHVVNVFNTALDFEENNKRKSGDVIITLTEGSNLIFLNYVVNTYPKRVDFLYGETLILKSFGTFIPKSVWADKPDGIGLRVGREISPVTKGLVLNTTILGDCWANFSYLGVPFILLVLSFVKHFYDKRKFDLVYSYMFFMVSLASWRFDFSFYFISIITIEIMVFVSNQKNMSRFFDKLTKYIFK